MSSLDVIPQLGAWREGEGVRFRVWAPRKRSVEVVLEDRRVPLSRVGAFFEGTVATAAAGLRYRLSVDGGPPLPDPWSHSQPDGVHGPSEVLDHDFAWHDAAWAGLGQAGQVFYELHVGTATAEGTFEALIPRLDALVELGVTAIELMPVASFPGARNWGYDGVFPFAPQASYGGSFGLKRLVDAAHARGLGVVLDLVLNHLGPEGNYLGSFGPYQSARHRTPWGAALDYDGPSAPIMRELALRTVDHWIRDHHVDGLRLDATHAIHDVSPTHLLEALRERALSAAGGREVLLIAEDGLNRAHLTRETSRGGLGLSMQWSDDFHHVVRRLVAGDDRGYFRDFEGTATELAQVVQRGWLYEGQPSIHFCERRGSDASEQDASRFVVFLQNHDQIGNRPLGDRLTESIPLSTWRALSALLLLGPQTPLLFMGQEWAARTPFRFFTDFEPGLGRAVRAGRRREAEHFAGGPVPALPDPQASATFEASRLDWDEAERPAHREVRALYRALLALRRSHPALARTSPGTFQARALGGHALELVREAPDGGRLTLFVNLGRGLETALPPGSVILLSTEEARFGGPGATTSIADGRLRLDGPAAVLCWNSRGRPPVRTDRPPSREADRGA